MSQLAANPLKSLEAGTGIEPVYTDLQSNRFSNEISRLAFKKSQDKAETSGERDTGRNLVLNSESENPGALGGAAGAGQDVIGDRSKEYRKPAPSAMSRFAKDGHKRACRMIGYALTADDPATWNQTAALLNLRLSRLELASVAFAALRALEPEDREQVFSAAQWGAV